MKAKPDCTGERFGYLTVVRKSDEKNKNGFPWVLKCDCGNVTVLRRSDFDKKGGRTSCGKCGIARRNREKLFPHPKTKPDCTGEKFGFLTVVRKTDERKISFTKNDGKVTRILWLLKCDCGKEILSVRGDFDKKRGIKSCGCSFIGKGRWSKYPPTPSPYPKEASELLEKYLELTKIKFDKIKLDVEDYNIERLIRVCWIIVYKRSQGEKVSEYYEKCLIKKYLKYSTFDVNKFKSLESHLDRCYNSSITTKTGFKMTTITSNNYPTLEVRGDISYSDNDVIEQSLNVSKPVKKFKFKRK